MAKRQRRRRQERRRQHGRQTRRRIATGAGVAAGAVLGMAGAAQADDFTVTNLNDGPFYEGPPGSLRRAIFDTNTHPGPDRILFSSSLSGTIDMTYTVEFLIYEPLVIDGDNRIAINAAKNSRIFWVNPTTAGAPVTISGLGVFNGGSSSPGGGILNYDAKLTVENSTFAGNSSSAVSAFGFAGGAIADRGDYANGAETTIRNSTFVNNKSTTGGAISSRHQLGTIINSTIVDNTAYQDGGGISSVTGGTILNSTIARYHAYGSGGGIATSGSGGPNVVIANSIVGDNGAGDDGPDLLGSDPFDVQFSLLEDTTGVTINSTVANSNITGTDPKLGSMSYGGGPTLTMTPEYDSPVIDQGETAGGETTDQRGLPRPFDLPDFSNSTAAGADGADMGAAELTVNETTPADLSVSITDSPDPVFVGDPLNYSFQVENNGPNEATDVVLTEIIPQQVSPSTLTGNCSFTGAVYIDCALGDIPSGGSVTQNLTVTPRYEAYLVPYISAYGYAYGDRIDPNTYDNSAYADTVVYYDGPPPEEPEPPPPTTTTPPQANKPDVGAIVRCKKRFHGKKRKKCIRRAKHQAVAQAQKRPRLMPRVNSRSRSLLPPNSRVARVIDEGN